MLTQKLEIIEKENLELRNEVLIRDQVIHEQEGKIQKTRTLTAACQTEDADSEEIAKLTKKVAYQKNRESKFLYLLFTLQNQGYPVN